MPTLPTLRQLAYLVELSERLNFRVAAEAQFVTQSTLSSGIKELETLLGVQLVERDHRSVRLTAVGADVVARARAAGGGHRPGGSGPPGDPSAVRTAAPRRHPHRRPLPAAQRAAVAAAR